MPSILDDLVYFSPQDVQQAPAPDAEPKKARQRESSKRHRQKAKNTGAELVAEVAALKEQVKTLQWANAELVAINKLLAENAAVDKEPAK
ncbi:hypothetical protein TYRP_010703 [Tyrophagus putrescentiae]|nr:hypothetical protein TYRP_010703 [Tyrophagus putrescentiae]